MSGIVFDDLVSSLCYPDILVLLIPQSLPTGRQAQFAIRNQLGFPLIFRSLEKPRDIGLVPEKDQETDDDT